MSGEFAPPRLKMLAALLLDHRLAFVILSALIISAAIPLAIAWTRLLPEEAPPFAIEEPASRPSQKKLTYGFGFVPRPYVPKRSRFSVALLVAVSVSFALQLPGLPRYIDFNSIPTEIPQNPRDWIEFVLAAFFLVIPGVAVAHSFLKPNLLSIPLIAAGVLVLLLWLFAGPLRAALVAAT